MAFSLLRLGLPLAVAAVFYRLILVDLISTLKPWRQVQPLSDFPEYSCRRMRYPSLEGCEDMWLDDEARLLFAACTGSKARMRWSPTVGHFDTSARPDGGSWISVLRIDTLGTKSEAAPDKARFHGYDNAVKGGPDLLGFDVEVLSNGKRRFWLVNQRPPVDAKGELIDATKIGSNDTIDVFEAEKGSLDLQFVKTIWHQRVHSPNKPAAVGDGSVLVTNDGSAKDGFRHYFDLVLGGGSVAYCSESNECHTAAAALFKLPNGMVRGKDGYFWVPNTMRGNIVAMYLDPEAKIMFPVTTVTCDGVAIDNLSVDKNGHVLAAGSPSPLKFLRHTWDPLNVDSPATVFQIVKVGEPNQYQCEKIIEDRDAEKLGGISVAVRDVRTSRIFTGGPLAPYITVCSRVMPAKV